MDKERITEIILRSYWDYGNYLYQELTTPAWDNFLYWLIGISVFFILVEVMRPWKADQPFLKQDFWLDIFYMFFNVFLFSLIGFYALSNVFIHAFNTFLGYFGISNLVAIELASLPVWAKLLTLFVLRDFIHWNIHRLLHRIPFLWEFHKVHHSAKEMNFATHLRFHPMETVIYRTLEYIPLAMIGFGLQEFFLVYVVALGIGHFNHSNICVPLGPLKYVLNNPQMHVWHHARDQKTSNKHGVNFGISLSIWDYLFKTAHVPTQGDTLELGYAGDDEMPKGFWKQAIYPLKSKREKN